MFEFLQSMSDFFQTGIYGFFTEWASELVTSLMIAAIEWKLWSLQIAWNAAQGFITALDLSSHVADGFALLPADVSSALSFFRVPEAVNLLMTAGATRFALSFIPV